MTVRIASCGCGQLSAVCTGEPFRISVCHCLDCKKRSGSAFAAQARWNDADVEMRGAFREWSRLSDSGKRGTFRFCGTCGATVAYAIEAMPGVTAIPIGAFAGAGPPATSGASCTRLWGEALSRPHAFARSRACRVQPSISSSLSFTARLRGL